jgi:PilZ domain-containing protein
MNANDLSNVAAAVVSRAREHGFVLPREVREQLTAAGLSEGLWKDVIESARPPLHLRGGRYYYAASVSDRARQQQDQQQAVRRAVRKLIRAHRASAAAIERRGQDRIDFIQPVTVRTEDGHEFTLLSRDLSPTGIRLIGTRRLLGQKVRVLVPRPGGEAAWSFLVRILWTCAVGEDLFENGGAFMEVDEPEA